MILNTYQNGTLLIPLTIFTFYINYLLSRKETRSYHTHRQVKMIPVVKNNAHKVDVDDSFIVAADLEDVFVVVVFVVVAVFFTDFAVDDSRVRYFEDVAIIVEDSVNAAEGHFSDSVDGFVGFEDFFFSSVFFAVFFFSFDSYFLDFYSSDFYSSDFYSLDSYSSEVVSASDFFADGDVGDFVGEGDFPDSVVVEENVGWVDKLGIYVDVCLVNA